MPDSPFGLSRTGIIVAHTSELWYSLNMTYLERVTQYANGTGMSVEAIITEALEDWFQTVGDARLGAPPLTNLVQFPVSGKTRRVG